MKSSGERKFYKFNAKFKPAFCQYNVVCSANFRFNSAVFKGFFTKICQNFRIKMSKFLQFHFQKIFSVAFQIVFRFFSLLNNKFFQFEDFQLQIFQAFIFFDFVLRKIFFRIIFVKFQRQIFQIFEELKFKISSRIFWAIAHNEKVLAKCGRKMNFSSVFNQTKPMLFQIDKITEKNNMKSSGECKFYQFNVKFKPAFCQYNVVCSANFRFFSSFQRFFHENLSKFQD